jgi:hypothetical protein
MKSTALALIASLAAAGNTCTPVTWSDNTHDVLATSGELTRTSGSGWNAGAVSTQQLFASAQPQSVSFRCVPTGQTAMLVGLNDKAAVHTGLDGFEDMAFSVQCDDGGGRLNVYETGTYPSHKGSFGAWTTDDVIKIQVTGTTVEYFKNGVVFYTSATAATFPLYLDAAIHHAGDKVQDVAICIPTTCTSTPAAWATTVPAGVDALPNVIASPGSLEKINKVGWNGAASSTQAIHASASPQSVSFKCATGGNLMFGLANAFSEHYDGLAFALECNANSAPGGAFRDVAIYVNGVLEFGGNGVVIEELKYGPDDVFKIQVVGTVVTFIKNDHVFHTSAAAATFPLYADASMYTIGSKLSDVAMCVIPTAPTTSPTTDSAICTPTPVRWKRDHTFVNVASAVNSDTTSIMKSAGGSGWNAAAVSSQVLVSSATPQSVSFRCGLDGTSALGLSNVDTNNGQHFDDIQFAVYCYAGNPAAVHHKLHIHESGVDTPTDVSYMPTDVITVQVVGTTVQYMKNEVVFYTSARVATFPLHVDLSMHDVHDVLTYVTICTAPAPTASPTTAPTDAPTVLPCVDTPASTAASAARITLERDTGSPVQLELLEDGVVRFTDATCLEATLCNTCGIGGGGTSSAVSDKVDAVASQMAAMDARLSARLSVLEQTLNKTASRLTAVLAVAPKISARLSALEQTTAPSPAPTTNPIALAGIRATDAHVAAIEDQGYTQCWGWGPGSTPTWTDAAVNCGDYTDIILAGKRCDGQWVEFDLSSLVAPFECFLQTCRNTEDGGPVSRHNHPSTCRNPSACPNPSERSGDLHRWFFDNVRAPYDPSDNAQYTIEHTTDWLLLGVNGNRWADPGRCWEPHMDGAAPGATADISTAGNGHILSQGCISDVDHQSNCDTDEYYIFAK